LVDEIYFQLPLAPFTNIILCLILSDIKTLFSFRHTVTHAYLTESKIKGLLIGIQSS